MRVVLSVSVTSLSSSERNASIVLASHEEALPLTGLLPPLVGPTDADDDDLSDVELDVGEEEAAPTPPPLPEPYFDALTPRHVTALLGRSARLTCRVFNLANRTVSWVRHRDLHILTVGSYTYSSDQRISASRVGPAEWQLEIRWVTHRDTGVYECQVSSLPIMALQVRLDVVVPTASILGGPDLYVNRGSSINLTCIVVNSPEPPAYIFWYHRDQVISYDSPRGGVSVATDKGPVTTTRLLVQRANAAD
ncbi:opioid-binding protein/cell adhesion molecule-like, partial [Schistocerca serialis cubense]|uniref:opioid-binding protein/cell adhesion molecule-like n=1 Tax=Schistocerca serialis cubense TaxID=2023355 RepID=UPI00214ED892